ncbi:putative alcohol dehydrogenase [Xylariaceae sp. FL1272]|nr:putative alcohol dehydrogenase [Xylariaceae sp. FL1272]
MCSRTAMIRAIVVLPEEKVAGVRDVPMPALREGLVLVRVQAVALNPADWKHIDSGGADAGSRVGFDYAGLVEEVGGRVTRYQKGDRIAGVVHGCKRLDHEFGAFGEYIIAKPELSFHIPECLSNEQAATLGVGIATTALVLYKQLGVPLPGTQTKNPFSTILIHGGSTATGILAIQYAKMSGLSVIATASPHNFEYLRTLGASAVFDYRSPTCAADIRAYTKNGLRHLWDCAGTGVQIGVGAMSDTDVGVYVTINPVSSEDAQILKDGRPNVDGPHFILGYDGFGEPYTFMGKLIPAKPESLAFSSRVFAFSEQLLAEGIIRPVRPTVNKGGNGLEGVLQGLDELRNGRVSGSKLVYTL